MQKLNGDGLTLTITTKKSTMKKSLKTPLQAAGRGFSSPKPLVSSLIQENQGGDQGTTQIIVAFREIS